MRDFTSRLAARCIDAVRLHQIRLEVHDGVAGYHKRRRRGMTIFYGPGNFFLRCSRSCIRMFADPEEWQQHEVESFHLCHPDRVAKRLGKRGLFLERLPGETLRGLARRSSLDHAILSLGAAELRRVHSLRDPRENEPWSHGDPHLGNVLFDRESSRCYLIDFETAHLSGCSATYRQADDVLTFCLELVGRRDAREALRGTLTFLHAYNRPDILIALQERLQFPRGIERILWATRTDYLPASQLQSRIQILRSALGE